MPEVQIYKLDLAAGDFSEAGVYESSDCGGADPPDANYPEFAQMENVHRSENAGASGQHVLDAVDTNDYTVTWVTLANIGNLPGGWFDARGGGAGKPLKCRWKQFFKSSALNEAGFSSALTLANGGIGGAGCGLFGGDRFFALEMSQDSGANFQWFARYLRDNGFGSTSMSGASIIAGSTDVSDDQEHEIIVTIVPSTVTGAYVGNGTIGSAVVSSDGSFSVTVDGVEVVSASGLKFVVNIYATTTPEVYYGKTIWHGD